MRKAVVLILAMLLVTTALWASPSFSLPNYYQQADFLGTTPGVSGDAAGGYFNPAVTGMMPWGELGFYWNDPELEVGGAPRNWALQLGGFGMQRWTVRTLDALGNETDMTFTDYKIGLGFGDRKFAAGMGYSWSRGDIPAAYERDNTISAGILTRPCQRASFGLAGHYAYRNGAMRGIADLGVRPFGNQFLTLFTDAALQDYQSLSQIEWSAGMAVQPVPGVDVFGKYYRGGAQDGSLLAGIALTFGNMKASYMPHYDKNSKQTYNSYGVRLRTQPNPDMFTDKAMKDKFYLDLKLNNGIKYQRYILFDSEGFTLKEMLDMLDNVKNDAKIKGLTLYITEDMWGSWELVWEVREKMKEVKAAGKKIIVFLERGGMRQYYLASVADKIMIDKECMVTMAGFSMGRTYYKDLFDKLGIGVDEWRFFTYKSAAESFSRNSMSEPDKEQRQAIIDDFYATFRADICASRGLTEAEFDHIIDEVGVLVADSILTYKLADTTGRWDDCKEWVKALDDDKEKPHLDRKAYAMMQPLDEGWSKPPQIAIIYGLGECAMNSGITANKLKNDIKKAREDKNIKAVVFRADSPGGDILPSDIVTAELKKTMEKKPVIVTQGQVAGSGGYWISMNSDKIVASPWTITGSIGVIGVFLYDNGFGDKIGLTYDKVYKGKHADLLGGAAIPLAGVMPDRNLTPEERAIMEKMIKGFYKNFVQKVAEARKMDFDTVEKVAQGRVWSGIDGKEVGLVDEIGGLEKAIAMALEAAKIDPESRWEIVEMPKLGLFDPAMFAPKLLGMKGPIYEMLSTDDPESRYFRMLAQASRTPMVMMDPEIVFLGNDER